MMADRKQERLEACSKRQRTALSGTLSPARTDLPQFPLPPKQRIQLEVKLQHMSLCGHSKTAACNKTCFMTCL